MKARDERHQVLLSARMRGDGPTFDVSIRNVSSRGMLIRAAAPPKVGSYVEVITDEVSAVGRVTWRNGTSFGIQTRERLPLVKLVFRRAGRPGPAPVPEAIVAAGGGAASVAPQHRGRLLARAIDFGLIAALIVALAVTIGSLAFGALSRPFETIAHHL